MTPVSPDHQRFTPRTNRVSGPTQITETAGPYRRQSLDGHHQRAVSKSAAARPGRPGLPRTEQQVNVGHRHSTVLRVPPISVHTEVLALAGRAIGPGAVARV